MEIHVLSRQGHSVKAIARQLGVSRNTVRKYLRDQARTPQYPKRSERLSKLEPFKPYLIERQQAAKPHWIPATVLMREIRELGYDGGMTILRSFMASRRAVQVDPVVRFETPPGHQLQVDFTTIRRGQNPLKAFVATLGYSRATYVHFSAHEDSQAWLDGMMTRLGADFLSVTASAQPCLTKYSRKTHSVLATGSSSEYPLSLGSVL